MSPRARAVRRPLPAGQGLARWRARSARREQLVDAREAPTGCATPSRERPHEQFSSTSSPEQPVPLVGCARARAPSVLGSAPPPARRRAAPRPGGFSRPLTRAEGGFPCPFGPMMTATSPGSTCSEPRYRGVSVAGDSSLTRGGCHEEPPLRCRDPSTPRYPLVGDISCGFPRRTSPVMHDSTRSASEVTPASHARCTRRQPAVPHPPDQPDRVVDLGRGQPPNGSSSRSARAFIARRCRA